LNIDTYFGDPLEMFFPQVRANEMKDFIPSVETIFDERAKHSVLLISVIEERANMTLAGTLWSANRTDSPVITMCHPRYPIGIQILELGNRVEANPAADLTICLLQLLDAVPVFQFASFRQSKMTRDSKQSLTRHHLQNGR
jgi:hypothetical protein